MCWVMQQSEPPFGVLDRVQHAVEVCSVPAGDRGVQKWTDLIGEVSAAMTVLAAARDAAIVRLAAIDEVVTEIASLRGTKFDPSLVEAFLPLAREMHASDFPPDGDRQDRHLDLADEVPAHAAG